MYHTTKMWTSAFYAKALPAVKAVWRLGHFHSPRDRTVCVEISMGRYSGKEHGTWTRFRSPATVVCAHLKSYGTALLLGRWFVEPDGSFLADKVKSLSCSISTVIQTLARDDVNPTGSWCWCWAANSIGIASLLLLRVHDYFLPPPAYLKGVNDSNRRGFLALSKIYLLGAQCRFILIQGMLVSVTFSVIQILITMSTQSK